MSIPSQCWQCAAAKELTRVPYPSRAAGRRCYFPGSHRNVAKYFQSHPQEFIDGTFQNSWGMSGDDDSFANDLSSLGAVRPPVESVMRAGSVCFAHGWIVHR